MKGWITVKRATEVLNVDLTTLYRDIKSKKGAGSLFSRPNGHNLMAREKELVAYLNRDNKDKRKRLKK